MDQFKAESGVLTAFGGNVRRLRVQAGLTQAKLAEFTGVELRTGQKWKYEEINPPLTTLARIQEVFGYGWENLLGEPKSKRR